MFDTLDQVAKSDPPAGFTWVTAKDRLNGAVKRVSLHPIKGNKTSLYLPGLIKWALENNIGLTPTDETYESDGYYDVYVYAYFDISVKDKATTVKYFGDGTYTAACGHNHAVGEWRCTKVGTLLVCQSCYRAGLVIRPLTTADGNKVNLCTKCVDICTSCKTEPVWAAEQRQFHADAKGKCAKCAPVQRCVACKTWKLKTVGFEDKNVNGYIRSVCKECVDSKTCAECGVFSTTKLVKLEGKHICNKCSDKVADRERATHEKFTADELPKHGTLTIANLPERPVRVVSIETEVDGDPKYLSKTLYNCGIVRVPEVEAYGTNTPETSAWPAFLKYDGSVTGGELISYLLQLDKTEHADAFLNTLSKVRSLSKVGKVGFNPNCGGHIHIDAHNFSSANVWRLLTVWNFLEDVIYRLAGSGHEYGHRTQVKGHDAANHGRGYANVPAKGPWGIKSNVTKAINQQDRMCGLNFKPYLGAVAGCRCGAFERDNLRTCVCVLKRCTIEWRVWNSQGNPRILHAWIAFMQSVHAFADTDEEPDSDWEAKFPTLQWTQKALKDTTLDHRSEVKKRLEWIFANLVFTDDERDSLIYAIKQSDLGYLGTTYIESLSKIEGPKGYTKRPTPKHSCARTTPIKVVKPAADKDPYAELSRIERDQLAYQRQRARYRIAGRR